MSRTVITYIMDSSRHLIISICTSTAKLIIIISDNVTAVPAIITSINTISKVFSPKFSIKISQNNISSYYLLCGT